MILHDQVTFIQDKIGQFLYHMKQKNRKQNSAVFESGSYNLKVILNRRIEGLIGLVISGGKQLL